MDYKQPRRVNAVSVLLVLALAAAGYLGWKFVPVYLRALRVQQAVTTEVYRYWRFRNDPPVARRTQERELRARLLAEMTRLGVRDQNVEIDLGADPARIWIDVRYRDVVVHPYVNKYTVLQFHRHADTSRAQAFD